MCRKFKVISSNTHLETFPYVTYTFCELLQWIWRFTSQNAFIRDIILRPVITLLYMLYTFSRTLLSARISLCPSVLQHQVPQGCRR